MPDNDEIFTRAAAGASLGTAEALALAAHGDLAPLLEAAAARRDAAHGDLVSYSPKVFIPLTHLCRDVCRYCTFARAPRRGEAAYLDLDEVVEIARAGARAGCREALFTLGDRPELRYRAAREALDRLGCETTIDYLLRAARRVREETGLLPHVNPGVMSRGELERLREVSVSAGLMLESASARLCERGGPHHGCPDKHPSVRLATLRAAGEARVPFTSGILIGIGETRRERIEALLALRRLARRYGHLQEVIVQNFRAKPGTAMARAPEPTVDDHLWTIAVARLVLDPAVSVQAPPNLSPGELERLLDAGINDWGGVSPVTPDHVNPEAPWPARAALERAAASRGKTLVPRLAVYPRYLADAACWLAPAMLGAALAHADGAGYAREDDWHAGSARVPARRAPAPRARRRVDGSLDSLLARARAGEMLDEANIVRLLETRGDDTRAVCEAADALRAEVNGDRVSYVVTRNINYTNVCYFACRFCAFSKGKLGRGLRGDPYDLDVDEIARRTREAWERGATEVCLQGGIHPDYTGETYLGICRAVKRAAPGIHVHAFSPLEIHQGARTLGLSLHEYLQALGEAGLGSLPGTAAEVLDDEVRAIICPDKISTAQWLEVMRSAHRIGLRSTATIMFGHVDRYAHQARHLLALRRLQEETGGFTELVPLPFVHMQAPLFLRGGARAGPTYREAVLMHAVARLVLHPHFSNIQTSWVKMGPEGAQACLAAGANDLGGTLMNESITRAAGAGFGEELPPQAMETLIEAAGRRARLRTTLYADAPRARREAALAAAGLAPPVQTPARPRALRMRAVPVRFGSA